MVNQNRYSGIEDPIAMNQSTQAVENITRSMSSFFNQELDKRRNIDDECGYPETDSITIDQYKRMYDREAVATRVVEVLPKESWQVQPMVFETEEVDEETAFEKAWEELGQNLRGESKFEAEEGKGNPIWEYLLRIDILSGIGSYGVLLLGVDDDKELDQPLELRKGMKILFLRAFDESLSQITQYEQDVNNKRFGQPNMYLLTFADPRGSPGSSVGPPATSKNVHWTRVIHVADNLGSSEILGIPRQRPVFNRLLDLRKLYGGSAEMYWKGAFMGLSIESHPQLGGDVQINQSDLRSEIENYENGLQRYLALMGMTAKTLAPQVVDPSLQIEVQLVAICILLGCPKRVFEGSERGQLASSQDDSAWNDRLGHRQQFYITPRIIAPFVDRCIELGILPEPKSYGVKWPDLNTLTKPEQAAIAVQLTEALAKFVGGAVENVMPPIDFFVRILGFAQEEAEVIIESVMASEEDPLTMPSEEEDAEDKEFDRQMQQKAIDVKTAGQVAQK